MFRAGAAGQLNEDQNLSFDANYQVLPEVSGRASVAWSLKRGPLNLLTYHRMINHNGETVIEGELAPTLNFVNRYQLRPNLAYRVQLHDPDANAYQASLMGVAFFDPGFGSWDTVFGLGAGGHYMWMPGTGASAFGVSLELQARLMQEIWLAAGYTFGGFEGITSDTAGGLYLRLDLVTGGQY